jgi:hypothetical protein
MDAPRAASDDSGRTARIGGAPTPARGGVTLRAFLAGLLLCALNVFFIVHCLWNVGGFSGSETLFANTVAALFLLTLLNRVLRRRCPKYAMAAGEMLTIYAMLCISTGLFDSVWDLGGSLAGTITYPFWFATPENKWQEMLWPNLPDWLTVQNRDVLEGFYAGHSSAYHPEVLAAWARPALWWALLLGTILWVTLCLNSLVRRRWEDEERLPFPMTILPVQLADARSGLLQNRLFWAGVAVAFGVGVWNALVGFFPALPAVPLGYDYTAFVANNPPWNFIRYQALEWGPWSIGLCYLMPLDMAFSLWVFDLVWTAEYVIAGHFAWTTSPWSGFPYGEQQTAGGFIAILVIAFWLDRKYLVQVLRATLGLRSSVRGTEDEAFSYRTAVFGALAGIGLLWWLLQKGGMPWWVAGSFLGLYFMMSLVISRLRAQIGPPTHQLYGAMPNWILTTFAGPRALGARTVGMLMVLRPYLQEQRNNPTPGQLEALKMADNGRMQRRRIALALAVVAPFAVLCYFWANLHLGYQMGMGSGLSHLWQIEVARGAAQEMDETLRHPADPSVSGMLAMGAGLIITLILAYLKLQFQWWPLHPIAFPLAPASTIQSMTLVIFGTWLFKSLLLRYGGPRSHLAALPFFLGLLAGGGLEATLSRILFAALGLRL